MQIYHGSTEIIARPEFGVGSIHNDYGLGFYCTGSPEMAMEWACKRDNPVAFVNSYEIGLDGLDVLNLSGGEYHILNWLAILLDNRNAELPQGIASSGKEYVLSEFLPHYQDADIIVGWRADDSYFSFARAFLNNTISLAQLEKAMRLGNLGEQIVMKSRKAFDALLNTGYMKVPYEEYFARKTRRDSGARAAFAGMSRENDNPDSTYMIDIIRNKWKNDDPRLR